MVECFSMRPVPETWLVASHQLPDGWLQIIRRWASAKAAISEVWLFGTHPAGTAKSNCDIALALILSPPIENHNWALGEWSVAGADWHREIETNLGQQVNLQVIHRGLPIYCEVLGAGRQLWIRCPSTIYSRVADADPIYQLAQIPKPLHRPRPRKAYKEAQH
jgi:hypothetical protein